MTKILQKDEKVLREIAKEIPLSDIGSEGIRKVLSEMREALSGEKDGVGIAAPQIGYSLRIFMIAPNLKEKAKKRKSKTPVKEISSPEKTVFINPEIVKLSKEKKTYEEGCLSVRPLYGKIERSARAKIKAYDEEGKPFEMGASGLLAEIFQHEVDHLNGILFIDKAYDLKEFQEGEEN